MKRIKLLNIAILMLISAASSCKTADIADQPKTKETTSISVPPTTQPAATSTATNIKCSLASDQTRWAKGNTAIISVTLTNLADNKIEMKTIPSFKIEKTAGMSYWAPVDLMGQNQPLAANTRSTISLEKGASLNTKTDISKLGWDAGMSSIWPAKDMYSVVPAGEYKLTLEIQPTGITSPEISNNIRSNELSITIAE